MNLHQFALDGVTLLGHLKGADGSRIELKDDLKENLKMSDSFATEFKKGVDQFIEKSGTEAPPEDETELSAGYDADVLTGLDLKSAGITSIIWANGYSFDFSWIHFPIFDEFGYPEQTRGVTEIPGLYFLGLHWMHTIKSGLFLGIAEDARHIADHIDRRNQNT